jgi:hypothetical protein
MRTGVSSNRWTLTRAICLDPLGALRLDVRTARPVTLAKAARPTVAPLCRVGIECNGWTSSRMTMNMSMQ